MALTETVLVAGMALWGIAALTALYVVYTQMRGQRKLVLVSFQLHPALVHREFKLLFGGLVLQCSAFILSAIGLAYDVHALVLLGRLSAVIFAGILGAVAYRWWRRARERGLRR